MVLHFQNPHHLPPNEQLETPRFSQDRLDSSTCSTPYVSAPSSPGRGGHAPATGYFFSAPASPMHFALSSSAAAARPPSSQSDTTSLSAVEFEFSSRFLSSRGQLGGPDMLSADELFLNGQIRPVKLSTHLEMPQILSPLLDLEFEPENDDVEESFNGGRDLKLRSRSLHRKARSLSPLRNTEFRWCEEVNDNNNDDYKSPNNSALESKESETVSAETTPSCSASSSRSSSSGRNSKKWIFLKDLLYRSKSEGRGNGKEKEKFWSSISFSPAPSPCKEEKQKMKEKDRSKLKKGEKVKKLENDIATTRRKMAPSPHEMHYTAYRAQAEEMKKRTYLPYRQGLFGCLGINSKSYGALNGYARTLNRVSSR